MNNNMSWLNLGNSNPLTRETNLSNDYNSLNNRPIKSLIGTSQNPIKLWTLDTGLYIFDGYVQHTNALLSEAKGLFASITVGVSNGQYVLSAFIPFWEGQYEYILSSLNSDTYINHQVIRMITQGNSLTLDNIREYTPSEEYHPSTKKYVDDTIEIMRNELGKMGLNNNDIQSLMKENRRRDIAIQALLSQNSDKMVTIDEEVHNISMDYSLDEGIATINTLEGDTLVNVSKDTEYDKILSYEQDIVENTNTVDLEVDGNLNPIIVGDTLVNVCTQNNPTAITNEYTVEGSNHFALQDEVEGNCRPIIQGNTIVNRSKTKDITPLTTYVSEVEGNEMSLVDDTDTYVRVNKLVGNTLVNLAPSINDNYWNVDNGSVAYFQTLLNISLFKQNTVYTVILNDPLDLISSSLVNGITLETKKGKCYTFTSKTEGLYSNYFHVYKKDNATWEKSELDDVKFMIFEGDLTQTPELIPTEYIKGLKNSYESEYISNDVWCNYDKVEASTSNVMSTITSEHSFEYKAQSSYSGNISPANMLDILNLKTEMTYTFIGKVNAQCTIDIIYNENISMNESIIFQPNIPTTFLFKTPQSYNRICIRLISTNTSVRSITFSDIILLEGDYTSNPPTYEEVMEHSGKYRCEVEVQGKNLFDFNILANKNYTSIVTEDGMECITFKSVTSLESIFDNYNFKQNTSYTLSYDCKYVNLGNGDDYRGTVLGFLYTDGSFDKELLGCNYGNWMNRTVTSNPNKTVQSVIRTFGTSNLYVDTFMKNIQLEEGNTATAYEPYYNQTQTVYLNSPLLKGDEVVYKEGKLYHYHKMRKVVLDGDEKWTQNYSSGLIEEKTKIFRSTNDFQDILPGAKLWASIKCENFKQIDASTFAEDNEGIISYTAWWDSTYRFGIRINKSKLSTQDTNGFKQWLSENPTTIVYELANPYYETISTSELLLPITTNCKLLTSSNIPLTTMSTRVFTEEVNILANTQYSLNFNSNVASTVNITLGGTVLSNQEIVQGYNKLSITTPSTLVDNLLIIEGSGVNISEVVVTEYDEGVCEYIEGLKSSFEDGWIPSEEDNLIDITTLKATSQGSTVGLSKTIMLNRHIEIGKYITVVSNCKEVIDSTPNTGYFMMNIYCGESGNIKVIKTIGKMTDFRIGLYKVTGDTGDYVDNLRIYTYNKPSGDSITLENLIVLEGDWTHLTEEDFNHLGQYKVEYKVVGKNKWNFDEDIIFEQGISKEYIIKDIYLDKGTYIINGSIEGIESSLVRFYIYDSNGNIVLRQDGRNVHYLTSLINIPRKGLYKIKVDRSSGAVPNTFGTITNIQLEKGTVATEYEPYKESIQTVYLNSPLLKGDTIEEIDGEVYHVHRYNKVVLDGSENWMYHKLDDGHKNYQYYISTISCIVSRETTNCVCDTKKSSYFTNRIYESDYIWCSGSNLAYISTSQNLKLEDWKQWLQENPTTIVYELATPTYELIPSSSIVCKSYPNGHLDFDTNVHIDNTVNFVKANLPITYANTSTNYKLQFVSDKDMENVTINALGNIMENVTITKGLNKISFTSPSDATNILTFEGIGYAYISNVQLVATDKDIDYFKGLYSTYECGLIEDESNENYGKYEVNIVSYNAPIQFGKGGKIE